MNNKHSVHLAFVVQTRDVYGWEEGNRGAQTLNKNSIRVKLFATFNRKGKNL